MTTSHQHPDLAQWAEEWQAGGAQSSTEQIRHYVKRRGGLVWSFMVADFVIGGIALPVLTYFGVMARNQVERFAMLSLASITVAAVGFGWWNWRGVLLASASSVSDYIEISSERLRRMRLAWRIAWLVLLGEVIVFSIWISNQLYGRPEPPPGGAERFAWAWLTGFSLAAAAGLVWFDRWLKRDEARFESLRLDLQAQRRADRK